MKTLHTLVLLLLSLGASAQHDSLPQPAKHAVSIELDPAPFLLGGYSVSVKFSPKQFTHFSVMGSVYSARFPDKMMDKTNYDNGFRDVKIQTSYALFTDYFVKENRSGLHFGPSVFLYSKSVGANFSEEKTSFTSIYPNVRVGYLFRFCRNSGFYINPWLNIGKEITLNGTTSIEHKQFAHSTLSYVMAVHIGYQHTF